MKKLTGKRIYGKNRSRGFTLVELLVTLIVLVMVMAMIVSLSQVAVNTYRNLRFESESSVLISTINTSLKGMLEYADEITTDGSDGQGVGNVTSLRNLETYRLGEREYFTYGINGGTVTADSSSGYLVYTKSSGDSETSGTVLAGEGIYGDLRIKSGSLSIKYDPSTGLFTYSFTVTDKSGTREKESGDVMVKSLMS